jgi:hypothetical protein
MYAAGSSNNFSFFYWQAPRIVEHMVASRPARNRDAVFLLQVGDSLL